MANLLFAGDQIHFVQLRLQSARAIGLTQKLQLGRAFLMGQLLLATALIFAWYFGVIPALAALAFLPLLIRGTACFFERQKPLMVRRLGWTELAHSVLFGIWLVAGFHLSR